MCRGADSQGDCIIAAYCKDKVMKVFKKIAALVAVLLMLAGCSSGTVNEAAQIDSVKKEIVSLRGNMEGFVSELATEEFVDWIHLNFGKEVLAQLRDTLNAGTMPIDAWHGITGNTAVVLKDMYSGALDKNSPNYRPDIKVLQTGNEGATIRIVGDVSFADNWKITPALNARGQGVTGVLSQETVDILKSADVFLANNEFTYSTRGKAIAGKAFTFRARPENVNYMLDIGADIVSLANNHAYDYGADAFSDTLETLRAADLPYIGGGENIEEAAKPYYFIINGRKYAFSAATKAEKYVLTPEATESSSGVMRTYDPQKYIEVIKTAEQQCDYNIVYIHWGAEGSHRIEDGLYEMGAQYIDAGADIVVGAHAHILQGIQYYKGIPIVYNLGNFIFNAETIDTGILEINIDSIGQAEYRFIPAIQKNCYTQVVSGEEKQRILEFMESLSVSVNFDSDGVFTEKK